MPHSERQLEAGLLIPHKLQKINNYTMGML